MVDYPDGSRSSIDSDGLLLRNAIGIPTRYNMYGTLNAGSTVNLDYGIWDNQNIYYVERILTMFKTSPVNTVDVTIKGINFGRHYCIGGLSFIPPQKAPLYLVNGDHVLLTMTNNEASSIDYDAIYQFVRFLKPSGFGVRPVAGFTPSATTGTTSTVFTFTNTSKFSPTSYDWDFGDGSAHSTYTSPTHQYSATGTYYVILTAYNAYGFDKWSWTVIIS